MPRLDPVAPRRTEFGVQDAFTDAATALDRSRRAHVAGRTDGRYPFLGPHRLLCWQLFGKEHLGYSIDAETLERLTDAYNMSIRAAGVWQPQVLDGDVLYFTATRDRRSDAAGHLGWAPLVRGQISNFDIDAAHLAMTEPGVMAQIAEILNARLNR